MKKIIEITFKLLIISNPTGTLLFSGFSHLVQLVIRKPITNQRWLLLALFLSLGHGVHSQGHLDQYIGEGLRNNLVLQQKDIALEKALVSLGIAKGMFMPTVNLQSSYTSGNGGRSISLPLGDMLNPVYATLNQLTDSKQFPSIENVKQNFFPSDFYDAHVRTAMPLLNTDLLYNQKIKQQQVLLQEFEVQIYKRELVKNIKIAYFNFLSAQEAVKIYKSALEYAEEGRRVNESLLLNGRGLPAYVLRAQSEIENINSQIIESEMQMHNAQLYFNFLLNKNPDASIVADDKIEKQSMIVTDGSLEYPSADNREELHQLRQVTLLSQTLTRLNQSFWIPKISAFADLGNQAQNWKFNDQSRYYLVGLQLDIPLFAGFTNHNKIRLSQLDVKKATLDYASVSQQLDMSLQAARNELISSFQNYTSAEKQIEAARSYQRLIDKGYKEGSNSFIETVDARTQITTAQLKLTINHYRVQMALANYERESASYPIKN